MQLLYNKDCNTEPSSGLVKGLATKPDHLTRLTRWKERIPVSCPLQECHTMCVSPHKLRNVIKKM